ncbi:MAG TPA: hypothetical protein VHG35_14660 [Gemmatimonadales bacterium]|nr:hypothetical protein [Gemmatimonadales bacterium]
MTQGETEHQLGIETAPTGRLLFGLLGGAAAWSLHFLASYAALSIGCVAGWRGIREILAIGTLVLLAVAVWSTVVAWREWRRVSGNQPWDVALGEPRGWFAYLMLTGVLMGVVSAFTIGLEGWGTLVLPVCGWDVR